jgi:alanine racemase
MVKSNAYGHGLLPVAKALVTPPGVHALAVARLDRALLLHASGLPPAIAIIVMCGFLDQEELTHMAALDIVPVIHTIEQVQLLETTTLSQPLRVWLKLDSGMHRLGFPPTQTTEILARLQACRNVQKVMGVMTHFAQADELDQAVTMHQAELFDQDLPKDIDKSLANSAAIIAWPQTHQQWVRPGIMLYGVSPFAGRTARDFDLQPVMTLKSRLIAKHALRKNATVGYGGTWACPEDMSVGIAAIGYGDGYPRHAKTGTPVLVNGVRCSLVGRVSMDLIIIDLRHNPQAQVGDPVILWGEGLPIEEVAHSAGTIAYELLCHVTSRVQFEYTQSEITPKQL